MSGRIFRVLVSAFFIAGAWTAVASPATAAACTGAGPVEISSLSFNPASITAGQLTTATMVAQNCTDQTIQGTSLWFGRYGTGTIPPGCPAIDPVGLSLTLTPGGQVTRSLGYFTLASCTATSLSVTVTIRTDAGSDLVSATATVPIRRTGTCAVTYHRDSEWSTGFTATVTITNPGTSPINSWQLNFSFQGDQHITNAWNAVVTQAGAAVTARNVSYNATIAPNASVSFGLYGTWATSDASPTAFTLNGVSCT